MTLKIQMPSDLYWAKEYVFHHIFTGRLGLDFEIEIGDFSDYKILIKETKEVITLPDCFFSFESNSWCERREKFEFKINFFDCSKVTSIPEMDRHSVPAFFYKKSDEYDLQIDIFGTIFFMLSSYEEFCSASRDHHQRFSMKNSALDETVYQLPLVDYYIEILRYVLRSKGVQVGSVDKHIKFRLTCDVDHPYFKIPFSVVIKRFIKRILSQNIKSLWTPTLRKLAKQKKLSDPYITALHYLCSLAQKANVKGIFYFIPVRTNVLYDADFDIASPAVMKQIITVKEYGHEIGMHPGYDTFANISKMMDSLQNLNFILDKIGINPVKKTRQHYLRWDARCTPSLLEEVKIKEDSTLGFPDFVGFRNGTSHPFKLLCLNSQKVLSVTEVPLIMMEVSLLSDNCMGVNNLNEANMYVDMIKLRIKSVGGTFTLLWHNSNFHEEWHHTLIEQLLEV